MCTEAHILAHTWPTVSPSKPGSITNTTKTKNTCSQLQSTKPFWTWPKTPKRQKGKIGATCNLGSSQILQKQESMSWKSKRCHVKSTTEKQEASGKSYLESLTESGMRGGGGGAHKALRTGGGSSPDNRATGEVAFCPQGAGDTALGWAREPWDTRPGPDPRRAASAGAGVGAAVVPGRTGWDAGLPAPVASLAGQLAPPGWGGSAPLHLHSDGPHGSEKTRFLLQ